MTWCWSIAGTQLVDAWTWDRKGAQDMCVNSVTAQTDARGVAPPLNLCLELALKRPFDGQRKHPDSNGKVHYFRCGFQPGNFGPPPK